MAVLDDIPRFCRIWAEEDTLAARAKRLGVTKERVRQVAVVLRGRGAYLPDGLRKRRSNGLTVAMRKRGCSDAEIAETVGLAPVTVRNILAPLRSAESHQRRLAKIHRLQMLWAKKVKSREIAEDMGWNTSNALARIDHYRKSGYWFPHRAMKRKGGITTDERAALFKEMLEAGNGREQLREMMGYKTVESCYQGYHRLRKKGYDLPSWPALSETGGPDASS